MCSWRLLCKPNGSPLIQRPPRASIVDVSARAALASCQLPAVFQAVRGPKVFSAEEPQAPMRRAQRGAGVAELADALDLGSSDENRGGSNPPARTSGLATSCGAAAGPS